MSYSSGTTFWIYCYLTEPSLRCTDLSEAVVSTVTMGVSKRGHVPVWRKGTMAVITTTAAPASTTLSTPRLHLSTLTRDLTRDITRDITGNIQNPRQNTALSSSKMFFEERLCPSSKSPWLRRYNHQPAVVTTWKLLQLFFSSQNASH